jgi:hypothetical protein
MLVLLVLQVQLAASGTNEVGGVIKAMLAIAWSVSF